MAVAARWLQLKVAALVWEPCLGDFGPCNVQVLPGGHALQPHCAAPLRALLHDPEDVCIFGEGRRRDVTLGIGPQVVVEAGAVVVQCYVPVLVAVNKVVAVVRDHLAKALVPTLAPAGRSAVLRLAALFLKPYPCRTPPPPSHAEKRVPLVIRFPINLVSGPVLCEPLGVLLVALTRWRSDNRRPFPLPLRAQLRRVGEVPCGGPRGL
mmetsp:Transcript_68628/g.204207  ORF Transcript_68628/g.204207 Transcript_68628/m.204207 type:complete len:208 (-) Transcript_68628:915-1538(-)